MLRKNYLFFFFFFSILLIFTLFLPLKYFDKGIFSSPDENINYFLVKEYADSSSLKLEKSIPLDDKNHMNHMRGLISHEGYLVPFGFLGLPIFYGIFFQFFKHFTFLITFLLALVSILYLYRLSILFTGERSVKFLIIFLLYGVPFLYWSNHPYMNLVPAISFLLIGIYYFFQFLNTNEKTYGLISTFFFAIATFFRYEYGLFILIFVLICYFLYLRKIKFFYSFLAFLFFSSSVLPVLILNKELYGSAITYGYSLFRQINFPDRSLDGSLLSEISSILLPETIRPELLLSNIYTYLVFVLPIFLILLFLSLLNYIISAKYKKSSCFMILLLIYIMIYAGSGLTWGFNLEPSIRASVLRYWMLPLLFSFLLLSSFFSKAFFSRNNLFFIFTSLLILSISSLIVSDPSSLSRIDLTLETDHSAALNISAITSEGIVITNQWDKYLSFESITLSTWWSQETYDPYRLTNQLEYLSELNTSIYLLSKQDYVVVEELNSFLNNYTLEQVDPRFPLYLLMHNEEII